MQTILGLLPLLACPLLMFVCMRSMSRSSKCGTAGDVNSLSPVQIEQRLEALMREELTLREAQAAARITPHESSARRPPRPSADGATTS